MAFWVGVAFGLGAVLEATLNHAVRAQAHIAHRYIHTHAVRQQIAVHLALTVAYVPHAAVIGQAHLLAAVHKLALLPAFGPCRPVPHAVVVFEAHHCVGVRRALATARSVRPFAVRVS